MAGLRKFLNGVGKELKRIRISKNISFEDAVKRSEILAGVYNMVENSGGKFDYSIGDLYRIATKGIDCTLEIRIIVKEKKKKAK